jgi:3-oxoacyl-[acyl-carrier-protein] synthase-3
VNLRFQDKRISGVLLVVPAHEKSFLDEMANFEAPLERTLKLKQVMGYDTHRIVSGPVCVSDLAVRGFEHLFATGRLAHDDLDALLLVTQTPDHLLPPTSSIIQGRLGLKQDMLCLDLNQGCAGFVLGLQQAFMLLEQPSIRKVALVNADVLSRKISPRDRNSYPLAGDAASITIVERAPGSGPIHANLKMDGKRRDALIIPAGGMRLPSSPETARMEDAGDHNFRAADHLRMDGSAVFNFVQVEVPPLIEDLLATAGLGKEAIDYFLCHQPNQFMLQKLADKMRVSHAKVPMNVVGKYGNSSGVTIPAAIALNLAPRLATESLQVVLAGFGVGLTWSSLAMRLGPLTFCETIDFPTQPHYE